MSYTTIMGVNPGVNAEYSLELKNSRGSGPIIWDTLGRYYSGKRPSYTTYEEQTDLWELHLRDDVPIHHKAVLLMTYDHAYILQKDYEQAASDIEQFLLDFQVGENRVNHWPEIANFIRNSNYPAIGFYMTSCGENLFEGDWNDEKDDYDSPDWSIFWSVYDHDALKEKTS